MSTISFLRRLSFENPSIFEASQTHGLCVEFCQIFQTHLPSLGEERLYQYGVGLYINILLRSFQRLTPIKINNFQLVRLH